MVSPGVSHKDYKRSASFGVKKRGGQLQTRNIIGAVTALFCEIRDIHSTEHSAEEFGSVLYTMSLESGGL